MIRRSSSRMAWPCNSRCPWMPWMTFSPGPSDAYESGYSRRMHPWSSLDDDLLWRPPACWCEAREMGPSNMIYLGRWSWCRLTSFHSLSSPPPRWLAILGTVSPVWTRHRAGFWLLRWWSSPFLEWISSFSVRRAGIEDLLAILHNDFGIDPGHILMGPGEVVWVGPQKINQSSP